MKFMYGKDLDIVIRIIGFFIGVFLRKRNFYCLVVLVFYRGFFLNEKYRVSF